MPNITDYVNWRGDLPFEADPFNAVDALLLSQLSYLDYTGIIPSSFTEHISLQEAADKYREREKQTGASSLGVIINANTPALLRQAGQSCRFGQIKVSGFINEVDPVQHKQFSAFTAAIGADRHCIVFRGTDDSIAGWKEDCLLSFLHPIPAQTAAADYLTKSAASIPAGEILLAGHSKGGNLAVYSGATVSKGVQCRIRHIFSYDGPGFSFDIAQAAGFRDIMPKVQSFIPEASIFGMLLYHVPVFMIVASSEPPGFMQHDLFSWQVERNAFIQYHQRAKESFFAENTVKTWLTRVNRTERAEFITILFGVIEATGALTLTELSNNWVMHSLSILKALHAVKPEAKKHVIAVLGYFLQAVRLNLIPAKEDGAAPFAVLS